jgi:hypothetical protein
MIDDSTETKSSIAELRSRGAGEDEADPYEDVDLSSLPPWWQRAIEEFELHGLRPYRPPRFSDGTLKHRTVRRLEERHDISLRFVGRNVEYGDDWEVQIDGESVGEIGRYRSSEGYTVFEMNSEEFARWIRDEALE